jgi:orotate phosphoribosyltransferase
VRESVAMITAAGGVPSGVAIALDRQERTGGDANDPAGTAPQSAVQFVQQQLKLPVVAIATLADLLHYLRSADAPALAAHAAPVQAYRERYGV